MKNIVLVVVCVGAIFSFLSGQTSSQRLSAVEAKNHIGEPATVCGKIVAARVSKYAVGEHGRPITFYLDEPSLNQVFSFVAWSSDPTKVEQTKSDYTGKQVCVTGTITRLGTLPHMIVTDPSHIKFETEEKK
jgi:hypothetical protein